ncbi:hypothetical protein FE257_009125 [Aspergillus nanangensis]|uniref:Uncharacterized protein n=1 Tax=Aspergillus nanangensis TaxID=2582783 RepID=A0AAD4CYP5_ASPNN|nr:hypothetical protein FE257_009125 [Aspergillus nanangensis]
MHLRRERAKSEASNRTPDEPEVPPTAKDGASGKSPEPSTHSDLSAEDIWMLLRRFNKEVYHVKSVRYALPHELDLNRANEDHFSPEKLRTTLEWFYTSVVISLAGLWLHISQLRSWKNPRRTATFCTVYFVAWFWNILVFVYLSAAIVMILSPSFQALILPPEAAAEEHTDDKNNTGPHRDSLTGAPEAHKGEAAEHEASNLVRDIAEAAMEAARSEYEDESGGEEKMEADLEADLPGSPIDLDDATQQPMIQKVSQGLTQLVRVVGDITETYERFCNLLSPTPPFYVWGPRLRFVLILGVVATISLVVSNYWLMKIGGFLLGLTIFGDPLFKRSIAMLDRSFPHWKEEMDVNEYAPLDFCNLLLTVDVRTLLKGVPTNAQLTLTLLRMGEMSSSPLSPPPGANEDDPRQLARRENKSKGIPPAEALMLNASGLPFPGLIKFVRVTIGIGIELRLALHRAVGIAGMPHPQHLIGMLRRRGWVSTPTGPLKFRAQFDHKRGTAVIDSSQEPPILYFTTHQPARVQDLRMSSHHKGSILFQIAIPDIKELQKTEQLGWKQKLILEMTGGVKHSVDGLSIQGKDPDQSFHLMSMKERDQLFNRLVAMGAQFWEAR